MLTEITLQRLAFIRYLYSIAVEQSRQSEPLGTASVLTFHDTVELFLQLAAEMKGVKTVDLNFMQYWDVLKPHLGSELSQKEEMRRLNKVRVDLKHIGILPSKLVVEALRANTTSFFEENTSLLFGIEFDKISMTYLIQNVTVKTLLDEATTLIEQGAKGDALDKIALSFAQLIDNFYDKNTTHYPYYPFGESMTFLSGSNMGIRNREFDEFVKKVTSSIEALQNAMKVISLGLDYQRYVKFQRMTPPVVRIMGDVPYQVLHGNQDKPPSLERCRFCYDFVVSSAIHVQNLDFEVEM
mgnify:CR=1 FL=1